MTFPSSRRRTPSEELTATLAGMARDLRDLRERVAQLEQRDALRTRAHAALARRVQDLEQANGLRRAEWL